MSTVVLGQVPGTSSNDDTSIPDLELGACQIAHLDLVPPCASSKEQLVRALLMLSYASLFVGVNAGIRLPAATPAGSAFARHQAAYYSVVAALLAAVPVEMSTAFWLRRSSSNLRFHAFAEGLQRAGVVLLIVVSAVGGIEFTLKA